ncbi:MAG: hypothetical protein ACRBCT_09305 [Alphaproteobacteria bacterium]
MPEDTKKNNFQPILLFRFGKTEHVKRFVENGEIYMNPVSYFKKIEGDTERSDKNENITGLHQAKTMKMYVNDKEIKGLTNQVTFYIPQQDKYMASHIFCMSCLCEGESIRDDKKIFDDKIKDFGEAFAVIGRLDIFAERLNTKLQSMLDDNEILRAHTKRVEYVDKKSYSGEMDIFKKTNDYGHQKEFRISITCPDHLDKPFKFSIGNLSDIAHIMKTKKFKNRVEINDQGNQVINV